MPTLGLKRVHAERVTVRPWERGVETASIVAPVRQPLEITALGGSTATREAGIEADVVEADSIASLDKLGRAAVEGKIVFLNTPMRRTRDGAGYGEAVVSRFAGAHHAQALGAKAVVIRSIGTDSNRLPHTGGKSKDEHEIPAGALSIPDADLLHRVLAAHGTARLHLTLTPRVLPETETANVMGDVLGRDLPDEMVLLGAHLDSWDLGTGALDDGAGCAIVLEAARLIAGLPQPPRRTIRVVLFANEEYGRAGAKGYAKAHEIEAARTVAAMEADVGGDRVYEVAYLGGEEGRGRFNELAAYLRPLGVEPGEGDAHSGADVGTLRVLGVPILELRQDASRYFDVHHTANDTLDKVDPDAIAQAAAAFATAAWTAAEGDTAFGRIPPEKRPEKW
jgi:Zn-dependent M28 family amino/carboxypeptidase